MATLSANPELSCHRLFVLFADRGPPVSLSKSGFLQLLAATRLKQAEIEVAFDRSCTGSARRLSFTDFESALRFVAVTHFGGHPDAAFGTLLKQHLLPTLAGGNEGRVLDRYAPPLKKLFGMYSQGHMLLDEHRFTRFLREMRVMPVLLSQSASRKVYRKYSQLGGLDLRRFKSALVQCAVEAYGREGQNHPQGALVGRLLRHMEPAAALRQVILEPSRPSRRSSAELDASRLLPHTPTARSPTAAHTHSSAADSKPPSPRESSTPSPLPEDSTKEWTRWLSDQFNNTSVVHRAEVSYDPSALADQSTRWASVLHAHQSHAARSSDQTMAGFLGRYFRAWHSHIVRAMAESQRSIAARHERTSRRFALTRAASVLACAWREYYVDCALITFTHTRSHVGAWLEKCAVASSKDGPSRASAGRTSRLASMLAGAAAAMTSAESSANTGDGPLEIEQELLRMRLERNKLAVEFDEYKVRAMEQERTLKGALCKLRAENLQLKQHTEKMQVEVMSTTVTAAPLTTDALSGDEVSPLDFDAGENECTSPCSSVGSKARGWCSGALADTVSMPVEDEEQSESIDMFDSEDGFGGAANLDDVGRHGGVKEIDRQASTVKIDLANHDEIQSGADVFSTSVAADNGNYTTSGSVDGVACSNSKMDLNSDLDGISAVQPVSLGFVSNGGLMETGSASLPSTVPGKGQAEPDKCMQKVTGENHVAVGLQFVASAHYLQDERSQRIRSLSSSRRVSEPRGELSTDVEVRLQMRTDVPMERSSERDVEASRNAIQGIGSDVEMEDKEALKCGGDTQCDGSPITTQFLRKELAKTPSERDSRIHHMDVNATVDSGSVSNALPEILASEVDSDSVLDDRGHIVSGANCENLVDDMDAKFDGNQSIHFESASECAQSASVNHITECNQSAPVNHINSDISQIVCGVSSAEPAASRGRDETEFRAGLPFKIGTTGAFLALTGNIESKISFEGSNNARPSMTYGGNNALNTADELDVLLRRCRQARGEVTQKLNSAKCHESDIEDDGRQARGCQEQSFLFVLEAIRRSHHIREAEHKINSVVAAMLRRSMKRRTLLAWSNVVVPPFALRRAVCFHMRRVFKTWRIHSRDLRAYRVILARAEQRRRKHCLQSTWQNWVRVMVLQSREKRVRASFQARRMRRLLHGWRSFACSVRLLDSACTLCARSKQRAAMKVVFTAWCTFTLSRTIEGNRLVRMTEVVSRSASKWKSVVVSLCFHGLKRNVAIRRQKLHVASSAAYVRETRCTHLLLASSFQSWRTLVYRHRRNHEVAEFLSRRREVIKRMQIFFGWARIIHRNAKAKHKGHAQKRTDPTELFRSRAYLPLSSDRESDDLPHDEYASTPAQCAPPPLLRAQLPTVHHGSADAAMVFARRVVREARRAVRE